MVYLIETNDSSNLSSVDYNRIVYDTSINKVYCKRAQTDNGNYIIFTVEDLAEGDSIYLGIFVNDETRERGDEIYLNQNGENKITIPEGYHIESK